MLRKKNKLPADVYSVDFELEYGTATIEVHKDSIEKNDNVLIIDDLIATGGTAEAAAKLVEISGGKVVANFIYKGPADDKQTKTVSLRLSNVPLTEVIRYVGQLTSTKFRYDEFAVVGIPTATVLREDAALKAIQVQKAAEQNKLKFDDPPKKDPFAK